MSTNVIFGAQWGDEGKCKIVVFLSENVDYVIRYQCAAHATDIANGNVDAIEQDRLMSLARHSLDWQAQQKYALDKCVFNDIETGNPCTMCGQYCSMKIYKKYF